MCANNSDTEFSLRKATLEDKPALERIIAESARTLGRQDYSAEQIEAALGDAWGVDTELIRDGAYFAAEAGGMIVGCGGWSKRRTLFGADTQADRSSGLLNPIRDAARIRAFFVLPSWARKGIGRALIERCELEAKAQGFHSIELVATLPGQRLYLACGYSTGERVPYEKSGISLEFISMRKVLV